MGIGAVASRRAGAPRLGQARAGEGGARETVDEEARAALLMVTGKEPRGRIPRRSLGRFVVELKKERCRAGKVGSPTNDATPKLRPRTVLFTVLFVFGHCLNSTANLPTPMLHPRSEINTCQKQLRLKSAPDHWHSHPHSQSAPAKPREPSLKRISRLLIPQPSF